MSLATCVLEAMDGKLLSEEKALELLAESDMPEEEVLQAALSEAYLRKRQNALQTLKTAQALETANSFKDHKGRKRFEKGILSLIVRHVGAEATQNIDSHSKAVLGIFDAKVSGMLDAYRQQGGRFTPDKKGLEKMVRAMYGETVEDPNAKLFGDSLTEGFEYLRQRFNRAGGAIKKLDTWRLPQVHDPLLVRGGMSLKQDLVKAKSDWVDFVSGLKIDKFTDANGKPLNPEDARRVLGDIWQTISSEGMNKQSPAQFRGIGKVANKGSQHRVLNFADADSWIAYQQKFGSGDTFSAITSHAQNMADDIASMEILGPNPQLTFNYLRDTAKQKGVSQFDIQGLEAVFRTQTGMGNLEQSLGLANGGAAFRASMSNAMLGGAFLSSLTDPVINGAVARFNGIPPVKSLMRMMSNLNPANADDRLFAVQMGMVADNWKGAAIGANRYAETMGKGIAQKISDVQMRVTLMSSWTEANRTAFGMEFSAFTAKNKDTPFDELPATFKKTLDRFGVTADDWAVIKDAKTMNHKGTDFVGGEGLLEASEEVHGKYMGMLLQEGGIAITAPDARSRAALTFGTQKGTLAGELLSTATLFKSFPVTMMNTHLARMIYHSTGRQQIEFGLTLGAGLWIMGAVALQAKEIGKGREPMDMNSTKFWGAAGLQSGGLGLLGDFVFSDHNRFGGGIGTTALGPMGQFANDLAGLTAGNAAELMQGEDTGFLNEAVDFTRRYAVPKPWTAGAGLVMDRMFDQLDMLADPKMEAKYNRAMRKQKTEKGNDYWYKKGEILPEGL